MASIVEGLAEVGYIASRRIATALYMAAHLQKPVLVEGSAGVGKTELALSTAAMLDLPLIRMQCYEGLDEAKALYEWKYGKQLLYTQILKDRMGEALADAPTMDAAMDRLHGMGDLFFSEPFLEPRPLLKALRQEGGAVLLIDEIDKSDEAFEAFLLEMLSAFQVSIPELGVVIGDHPADRVPDLQQRPRPGRRAEAPLPAPAHPPARPAAGGADRRQPRARASRRA